MAAGRHVTIKTRDEIAWMQQAGLVVEEVLLTMQRLAQPRPEEGSVLSQERFQQRRQPRPVVKSAKVWLFTCHLFILLW